MKTRHGRNIHGRRYAQLRAIFIEARQKLGLTQRQLAAKMKRDKNFVQRFEDANATLDIVEYMRYAKALKLDDKVVLDQIR